MKKLLLFAFMCTASLAHCQETKTYQSIAVTAFTAIEFENSKAIYTAPINFSYNIFQSFSPTSDYFYGMAAGPGISFKDGGEDNISFNFIGGVYVGGQLFKAAPAMAIGAFRNFVSNNYGIWFNLNFSPTKLIKSIEPSAPRYTPLITNSNYRETKIGFKPE